MITSAEVREVQQNKKSIFTDGVLLDLDIGYWRGWTKLNADDLDKEEKDILDVFALGKKRMLRNQDFSNFTVVESRARSLLQRFSYPFMLSTVRFVPFTTLKEMLEELEILKKGFNDYTDLFLIEYDGMRENFLSLYTQLRNKLEGKYPTLDELQYKYYFRWTLMEISIPRDVKAQVVDESQADELQNLWKKEKVRLQGRLESWVDDMGSYMRTELLKTIKSISDALEDGKIIRESSLDKVRDTISRVRKLNILDDKEVIRAIETLAKNTPIGDERKVPAIMDKFSETLNSLQASLSKSDVSEFTGDYKRRIIL